MKNLLFIPCFVVLTVLFSGVSQADFKYIRMGQNGQNSGGLPQVSRGITCPTEVLTVTGNETPAKVNGFGNGLPLSTAVRMLVPSGWQIDAKQGVNMATPVSWRANQTPWTEALREALKSSGMTGSVSMNDFTVVIQPHLQNCVKPVAAFTGQFQLAPSDQAAAYPAVMPGSPRGVPMNNRMNESGDAR